MTMHSLRRFVLLSLVLSISGSASRADWSHDVSLPDLVEDQGDFSITLSTVSDGAGGLIVQGMNPPLGLYVQRIDRDGNALWGPDGLIIFPNTASVIDAVADGSGGIVAVVRVASQIRIQWVDGAGTLRFPALGLDPTPGSSASTELDPSLAMWGEELLVSWLDNRNGNMDVFAQRIDSGGGLGFGSSGLVVCVNGSVQDSPKVAITSDNEAVIAWQDPRTSSAEIYAQRFDVAGLMKWPVDGIQVLGNGATSYQRHHITASSFGAVLIAANFIQGGVDNDIFAQRVSAGGGLKYPLPGVAVCVEAGSQSRLTLSPDGSGGALMAWTDSRPNGFANIEVYIQRLNAVGTPIWTSGGVALEPNNGFQGDTVLRFLADDTGGGCVLFNDSDYSPEGLRALYVNGAGVPSWPNSILVTSTYSTSSRGDGVWDDHSGFIFAFAMSESSTSVRQLYRSRIDRLGLLGAPAPRITGVTDFPQDQGGVARVDWDHSYLDGFSEGYGIDRYSVWMRYGGAPAKSDDGITQQMALRSVAALRAGVAEPLIIAQLSAGWAFADLVDAVGMSAYTLHAPTYADSSDTGMILTDYQVLAHLPDGGFLASHSLAGYSVDNLAPGAPLALSGQNLGMDVGLQWSPSTVGDGDLRQYRIFRAATSGLVADGTTLVGTASDTLFTDAGAGGQTWYYRVAAVDVHGNQGAASNETEVIGGTSAVDDLPNAVVWLGASPNPFNPRTTLSFSLPRAMAVVLTVYDARGRLMRVLADGQLGAGPQSVSWDGRNRDGQPASAGVYLAVLRSEDGLLREKMTLLK